MLEELRSLRKNQLTVFWDHYLKSLATSIKVDYHGGGFDKFLASPGFGDEFAGYSWAERAARWYSHRVSIVSDGKEFQYVNDCARSLSPRLDIVPIFENYAKRAYKAATKEQTTTIQQQDNTPIMKDSINNTFNSVMNKNKEAVGIAAQLSAGKAANSFFLSKLLGKFPWYAKLFAKKNDMTTNPVAKIVAAQTAMTLVTHFAADNKKLNYIAEGMVQEALVDVTLNSNMLESMIRELESVVKLPNELKD